MRQESESKMENCEHTKYLFLGLLLVLQFAPYPINYSFCVCVCYREVKGFIFSNTKGDG